ncbi:MAG TPA: class I SAM-dependent methyltransferase, partial [Chitinophagaceae bacterium]
MTQIQFKEIDQEGLETLQAIALADQFNEWMYQTIKPFCKGRILEIGSGIGNISTFFIRDGAQIMLSDIRPTYCEFLSKHFADKKNCEGVVPLDLVHPEFDQQFAGLLNSFDTVFALNVVEHIEDHDLAIRNALKLLRRGGNLVILVPAGQWLYNRFDKELGHYRRYTRKKLKAVMAPYTKLLHTQYFNLAGMPGWFISGKILGKKTIPKGQMKLFNKLVPVFKFMDRLVAHKIGLSVIGIGQKN